MQNRSIKASPLIWLKEIRAAQNLSTYKVASSAGISQSHYNMIENGWRGVPVKTAKAIAGVLRFDWQRFYEE